MSRYTANIIAKREGGEGPLGVTKITHIGIFDNGKFVKWVKHTPGLINFLRLTSRIPIPEQVAEKALSGEPNE